MSRFLFAATAFSLLLIGTSLAGEGGAGMSSSSWPDLSTSPTGASEGANDAAVVIAIEDYAKVDDVLGAGKNANDWMTWLLNTRGVPAQRVMQARDGDASDLKIRELARRAAEAVQPGGTLWFVFIGHGAPSRDGADGLLVGADADRSADGIYARSVPRKDLLAALDTGAHAEAVVVLDACFSGQTPSGGPLVGGLQPLIPTSAFTVAASRTVVLTAASSGEFAGALPGEARPAFSYLALGALRGWGDVRGNRDGFVSASEVRDYALGALNLTVTGRSQTPSILGADAPLTKALDLGGPDLSALARVSAIRMGNGEASVTADDSIARLAADAKARESERTRAEAVARESKAKQLQDRRARLDALASDVRAAAARDAASISDFLSARTPPPEAVLVLDAFLVRYAEATVKFEGVVERVEIVDVPRVREAKGRAQAAIKAASDLKQADELRYGAAVDYAASAKFYEAACAVEFADVEVACGELAWFTGLGKGGVKKETTRTTELGAKSRVSLVARCDDGDLRSCRRAGTLYENGWGVTADPVRAADLYKKSCDGGEALGCIALAQAYAGGVGVQKDPARAAKLYEQACKGGTVDACVTVGLNYLQGTGVEKDGARGLKMVKDACDDGLLNGCRISGWAYETGTGVAKDDAQAMSIYTVACEKHDATSCYNLGGMVLDGRGATKDSDRAMALRKQACTDGSKDACEWVKRNSYSYRY